MQRLLVALVLALVTVLPTKAQSTLPLDPNFGLNGRAGLTPGKVQAWPRNVARYAPGRYVGCVGAEEAWRAWYFTAQGLDPEIPDASQGASCTVVLPDAGVLFQTRTGWQIRDPNGSVRAGFGEVPFPAGFVPSGNEPVQSDGSVLIPGRDSIWARLTVTTRQAVATRLSLRPYEWVMGTDAQGAYYTSQMLESPFVLQRYLPNGTRDATYGSNGAPSFSEPFYGSVLPDGTTLLFGYRMGIARLTPGGVPDSSFGTAGQTPAPDVTGVYALPNGQIAAPYGNSGAGAGINVYSSRGEWLIGAPLSDIHSGLYSYPTYTVLTTPEGDLLVLVGYQGEVSIVRRMVDGTVPPSGSESVYFSAPSVESRYLLGAIGRDGRLGVIYRRKYFSYYPTGYSTYRYDETNDPAAIVLAPTGSRMAGSGVKSAAILPVSQGRTLVVDYHSFTTATNVLMRVRLRPDGEWDSDYSSSRLPFDTLQAFQMLRTVSHDDGSFDVVGTGTRSSDPRASGVVYRFDSAGELLRKTRLRSPIGSAMPIGIYDISTDGAGNYAFTSGQSLWLGDSSGGHAVEHPVGYPVGLVQHTASGALYVSGVINNRPVLARFTSTGTPDLAFGTNGVYVHPGTATVSATELLRITGETALWGLSTADGAGQITGTTVYAVTQNGVEELGRLPYAPDGSRTLLFDASTHTAVSFTRTPAHAPRPYAFRVLLPASVDAEDRTVAPAGAFTIGPNPANQNTVLRLSLDKPMRVRVQVYDVIGREQLWVDVPAAAGSFTHSLNTQAWTPGTYIVRVTAGDRVKTSRLVVMH